LAEPRNKLSREILYDSTPFAELLEADPKLWRGTLSLEKLRGAAARAAAQPGAVLAVRRSWWSRLLRAWRTADVVFVSMETIEGGAASVPMYHLCSASTDPGALVGNLALALRAVGSSTRELVTSLESRDTASGGIYMHAISAIPSSRVS
jgi:hypothetical protein